MHILEAAMISNLRRSPKNRAIAQSGPPKDALSSMARLATVVALVGLLAVGLDSASAVDPRHATAAKVEVKAP